MEIVILVQLHNYLCNILEDSDVKHNSPSPCPGSYIDWFILKEILPFPHLQPPFFFLE